MLEINFPSMGLTIVVFLFLIYFLNKILYKPLLSFMDARENSIKSSEDSIRANSADVDSNKAEIEEILNQARGEANRIKQLSLDKAKEKSAEILSHKKSELEASYSQFALELDRQKQELKDALKAQIPEYKNSVNNALAKI